MELWIQFQLQFLRKTISFLDLVPVELQLEPIINY